MDADFTAPAVGLKTQPRHLNATRRNRGQPASLSDLPQAEQSIGIDALNGKNFLPGEPVQTLYGRVVANFQRFVLAEVRKRRGPADV